MKTLEEARRELQARLADGTTCQCCGKHAQQYTRRFNAAMGRSLIWLARRYKANRDWVDVPNEAPRWLLRTKQLSTVALWGLISRKPNDDTTKKHSGLWRPTRRGFEFVLRRITIPSAVTTYNNEVVEFSDERVYIEDVLGKKFDYAELMRGGKE